MSLLQPVGMYVHKYEWSGSHEAGDCSLLIRVAQLEFDDGLWECQVTASDFTTQDALTSQPVRLVVRGQSHPFYISCLYSFFILSFLALCHVLHWPTSNYYLCERNQLHSMLTCYPRIEQFGITHCFEHLNARYDAMSQVARDARNIYKKEKQQQVSFKVINIYLCIQFFYY